MHRKAWIAIGVVAGGFLLYELLKPGGALRPTTAPKVSTNSGGSVIAGLLAPLEAVGSALISWTNTPSPSGPNPAGSAPGAGYVPPNAAALQGIDPNTGIAYDQEGIDPSTGGVSLPAGGTYGPPVPSANPVISGGDDGLISGDQLA